MKIETLPTSKLVPYARNARTHSEVQIAQIAGSIREFGFTNPVLIDSENGIIAGHGRVLAAQVLEIDKVYESTVQVISQSRGELMRLTADLPPRLAGQPAAAIAKIMRVEIIALLTRLSGSFADAGQLPK